MIIRNILALIPGIATAGMIAAKFSVWPMLSWWIVFAPLLAVLGIAAGIFLIALGQFVFSGQEKKIETLLGRSQR